MFVSQVIFESFKENGVTVGYCHGNKWESKADFQVWIKAAHTEKSHNADRLAGNAVIKNGISI